MSVKQPVIKFSPFEALFIGEKNRILKRQPMKNTIFVTRIQSRRKAINLRDLFDLEKDSRTETKNDVIFKMPQRVCEFLKNRKYQNKSNNGTVNNKIDILHYEFEGQKMITQKNNTMKSRGKNAKLKSNKVKFKRKFKYKDNIKEKIVRKFPNYPRKNYYYYNSRYKNILPRVSTKARQNFNVKRHSLRGKDGKFICKSEHDKLKSKEISTKQKYISKYLHHLYLKKNKQFNNNNKSRNKNIGLKKFQNPYAINKLKGIQSLKKTFDTTNAELILDEVFNKYFKNNYCEDFSFPKFPKSIDASDFEEDCNLLDIIYENFPKSLKFGCKCFCDDFSAALLNTEIVKPENNLRIYKKKKNGFVKEGGVTVILDGRVPCLKLRRLDNIESNHCPVRKERNGYLSKIDEPYTKKSHLISGKSFGSFFFRSAEGKDVFIGNLVKPFLQNSWFGSLPEF